MARIVRSSAVVALLLALAGCGSSQNPSENTGSADRAPPATQDDAPSGWTKAASVTVHLKATDDASGVTQTCYTLDQSAEKCATPPVAVDVKGDGTHALAYHSVDGAGNVEPEHTIAVKLDTTPPVTTDDAPTGWVPGLVYVNLTATDGASGVAEICHALDGGKEICGASATVLVSGDADHVLAYHAVDNAGNVEATHMVHIEVEQTTLPVLAVDATRKSATQLLELGCAYSAGLSGVDASSLRVSVTDATGHVTELTSCDAVPFAIAEAPFTFAAKIVDQVGHVGSIVARLEIDATGKVGCAMEVADSTPGSDCGAIENIDDQAPVSTTDAPSGWMNQSPVTVDVNATDDWSSVAQTCYTLDSGAETCAPPPVKVTVSGDGTHVLAYHSVDGAGNVESTRTANIGIDTQPPTTTDDAPAGWSRGPLTVNLNASDSASGVQKTCYSIDSGPETCAPPPVMTASFSSDGDHILTYDSVDNVGNAESAHTTHVKIDDTEPTAAVNATWRQGAATVDIGCTTSDFESGVSSSDVVLTVDGSPQPPGCTMVSFPGPSGFSHDVVITATDRAGNTVTSEVDITGDSTGLQCTPIASQAVACGSMSTMP